MRTNVRFIATHRTLSPGRSTILQAHAAAGAQAEPPDRCESSRAVLTVKQNACCFTSTSRGGKGECCLLTSEMRKLAVSHPTGQSWCKCRAVARNHIVNASALESESCSVMSDTLWPHGLYGPWNCPGQNIGVGSHSLLQGIFPAVWRNCLSLHPW